MRRCSLCNRRLWWLNHGHLGVHPLCKWYEFLIEDDQGVGP